MKTYFCVSSLYAASDLYSFSSLNFLCNCTQSKGDVPRSRTRMKGTVHGGLIKDPFSFGWQQDCLSQVQVLLDERCEDPEPVAIIWELLLRSHGLENSCIEKLHLIIHSWEYIFTFCWFSWACLRMQDLVVLSGFRSLQVFSFVCI